MTRSRRVPRVRVAVVVAAAGAVLAGCIDDLDPVTRIDRTRALAAVAEVEGLPDETYPAAGERVTTRFTVAGYDPVEGLTWLLYACRAAPIRGGVQQCTFGAFDEATGTFTAAPVFAPEVDDGDTVNGVDPDAFLAELRQEARTPLAPAMTVRVADPLLPTTRTDCPDEDAVDGAGYDSAEILFTGAICGPGTVPRAPPFVAAFEAVLRGEASPEVLFSDDPQFHVTRCVDAVTGQLDARALREEEAVAFTLPIRLPAPAPTGAGNRRPRLVDPPAPGRAAFLLGQGTDCTPGFDYENGPALEDALRAWPETSATRCDDPTFPEAAKLRADAGDVCVGVRTVVPRPGDGGYEDTVAFETFDPDGEGVCGDGAGRGDRPLEWERLSLAIYATAGELDRLFSNFEVEPAPLDPPVPVEVERNPAFVEWQRPDEPVPPEGQRIDFYFVLRDRREGTDVAQRSLCLLPGG